MSTEWVYNRLGSVKIIDTTRHITPKKDGKEEFDLIHIWMLYLDVGAEFR